MSMGVSRARLDAAMKQLLVHWEIVKTQWDDPVSREFEARHLKGLGPAIQSTANAMEKMEAILARARRDCE